MLKFFVATALIAAALPAHAEILGYECRAAVIRAGDSSDLKFRLPAGLTGHQSVDKEIDFKDDHLVVSVNTQMLALGWSRGEKTIASSMMMFQRMVVPAYVLIVTNPENPGEQASLDCATIDSSTL